MSDNVQKLIPSSPVYVPSEESILEALNLLKSFFPSDERITYNIFESPRFIDQGTNFERICCPKCNSIIDDKWWQSAMTKAYENNFQNLSIKTPCCGEEISLNDLKYEWPAGFARFIIEIRNSNMDVTDSFLRELENVLRSRLRKIWAHY